MYVQYKCYEDFKSTMFKPSHGFYIFFYITDIPNKPI